GAHTPGSGLAVRGLRRTRLPGRAGRGAAVDGVHGPPGRGPGARRLFAGLVQAPGKTGETVRKPMKTLAAAVAAWGLLLWHSSLAPASQEKKGPKFEGFWQGTLTTGPTSVKFVFHITSADGKLTGTLGVPDLGVKGVPFDEVEQKDAAVRLVLKKFD